MKKILLAAMITLMTVPAFSNEQMTFDDQNAVEEQQMDMNYTPADEDQMNVDDEELQPGRRRFVWTCYARDIFGRTYWGRSWNRGLASRLAMRTCQRRGPGPIRFCRFVGCRASRW